MVRLRGRLFAYRIQMILGAAPQVMVIAMRFILWPVLTHRTNICGGFHLAGRLALAQPVSI